MKCKVRAGSLIYALCITLILSILSGSLILLAFNTRALIERNFIAEKQLTNVSSALNYYLTNASDWGNNGSIEVDLFNKGADSVEIRKKLWGLFDVVNCRAHQGATEAEGAFMVGDKRPADLTALYLSDQNKPLAVCGKTLIKGKAFLPLQGIKRAYIEGQNFMGSQLVEGVAKVSGLTVPELEKENELSVFIKKQFNDTDSILSIEELQANKVLVNSFKDRTIVLLSKANVDLDNYTLKGNVIIKCVGTVTIKPSSVLQDILIFGNAIEFKKGFAGNLQAFAEDSITVGEEVTLNYPSTVCILVTKKAVANSRITLFRNSLVKGNVVNFNAADIQSKYINIKMDEGVEVTGLVYTPGYMDFKGDVTGSLYCGGFILRTPSAVYENHLLNAVVNAAELPGYYVGRFIGITSERKARIKKLL
jgi:hypothetical protein